jgi:hypothetical protein
MGHLHGHAQVHLIINRLRDAVQDGLPESSQIGDIGLRAPRLVRISNCIIDELIQRGVLGVEVAEHAFEDVLAIHRGSTAAIFLPGLVIILEVIGDQVLLR